MVERVDLADAAGELSDPARPTTQEAAVVRRRARPQQRRQAGARLGSPTDVEDRITALSDRYVRVSEARAFRSSRSCRFQAPTNRSLEIAPTASRLTSEEV
jgi:hypothetical protein